jgi:hypothetical protein
MNLIPPSFEFKGDKQKAISLKSHAYAFYNHVVREAEREGLKDISRTKILPDGSVITFKSSKLSNYDNRPGKITIVSPIRKTENSTEESIYLESGYMDVVSMGTCDDDSWKPGKVRYSPKTSMYMDNYILPMQGKGSIDIENTELDDYPFTGEQLDNGFTSKSLACRDDELIPSIVDFCGVEHTDGPYCVSLRDRKKPYATVPPSLYSGKLRLFIQSLYGSKRTDYEVVEIGGIQDYGSLNVGGLILKSVGKKSFGIFTTTNYKYFLIEIGTEIKYYPITFSKIGKDYIDILSTHPNRLNKEFAKRVEAYAFTEATFDVNNVIHGPSISIEGNPLFYGWSFNWDGDKADIVTYQEVESTRKYKTRHYGIQFTYNEEEGTFSSNLQLKNEGDWYPQTLGLNVFYPMPIISDTTVLMPIKSPGKSTLGNEGTITNAPIHCYYSMSDELVLVTWSSTFTNSRPTTIYSQPEDGCSGVSQIVEEYKVVSGLQGSSTIQIGSFTKQGSYESLDSYRKLTYVSAGPLKDRSAYSNRIVCGTDLNLWDYLKSKGYIHSNGVNYNKVGDIVINGVTIGIYYQTVFMGMPSYSVLNYTGPQFRGDTACFIQIPYDDCCSIIFGNRDLESISMEVTSTSSVGNTTCDGFRVITSYYNPFTSQTVEVSQVEPPTLFKGGFGDSYASSNTTTVPIKLNITSKAWVIAYDGASEEHEEVYNVTDRYALSEYFDILYFSDPLLHRMDVVRSDTSGGKYNVFKAVKSDTTDYPATCSIGWV